ncbi:MULTISPECIES: hypothetical protein [Jannaschia]|uniref:hypothetical protein n=1 Tax=Jannaschia TaxID=188905 RepID=UPI001C7D1285|nr:MULTISPECIES: hypothetical protein [unclassified Jannaschia]
MHADLTSRIDAVDRMMAERLYLSGSLARKLAAARGRLPRVALAQANELVEAQARLENPATARHLNAARIEDTCKMLERHLVAVPKGKYRRRAQSAMIGLAALRVLIVLALFIAVLSWRGFI